jgi:predicted TIM-barrel fold metal-dependent hydrolase
VALAEGGYDDLFSTALECGLTAIFVATPGNTPALEPSLAKFPDIKFVIDHCGMPTPAAYRKSYAKIGVSELPPMGDTSDEAGKAAEFDKVLRLADEHGNVGLKWAHAQRMFGVSGYPFVGLRPYLRKALNSFGAERVMWASDASANQTGESWAELLFWLMDNPDLSASERTHLLGGTARKWLNWPLR